jgi:hypothetical protein
MFGEVGLGCGSQFRELLDERRLGLGQFLRDDDLDTHFRIASARPPKVADSATLDGDYVTGLRSGLDVNVHRAIERLERRSDSPNCVDHVDLDCRQKVVSLARPEIVWLNREFHVDVSGWTARFTDFSCTGKVNAHSAVDTTRNLHIERSSRTNAPVPSARWARSGNDRSVSAARPARRGGDDVSEQAANLALQRAGPSADVTALRRRARGTTRTGTGFTQRGGVDFDRPLSPKNGVDKVNLDPQQGIVSAFLARTRSALLTATEKRIEHVAHRTETGHPTLATLATHVIVAALFRVAQNVERVRDELETFRRVVRRVHIGV